MSTVQGGQGNIVTSGLVLNLDAANPRSYLPPYNGTTWFNLASSSNNGTLTNSPTYNTSNGGSIVFDGVDDYVSLSNGILSGTGDFTVNQWIKCDSSETGGTLFGNFPSGNLQVLFGSRYIAMWLNNNSTYLGTSPWNTTLPQFTTSSIMMTVLRSGTTTALYLNSILQKTGSSSDTIGTTGATFRIGDNTNSSGGEQYKGNIYNIQVYNRALSASEINQNFQATRARFGI